METFIVYKYIEEMDTYEHSSVKTTWRPAASPYVM